MIFIGGSYIGTRWLYTRRDIGIHWEIVLLQMDMYICKGYSIYMEKNIQDYLYEWYNRVDMKRERLSLLIIHREGRDSLTEMGNLLIIRTISSFQPRIRCTNTKISFI